MGPPFRGRPAPHRMSYDRPPRPALGSRVGLATPPALAAGTSLFWLMSGQYRPAALPAADPKPKDKPPVLVSGDKPVGKFWGNDGDKTVIAWDGAGVDDKGTAIAIRFEGPGWRGCGFNWKGWYPA